MPNVEKPMLFFGKMYELLCKIPVVGLPMVKAYNRGLAALIFRGPNPGGKPKDDIEGVKEYLLWTGEEMNFPFEVIEDTVGPESFEFYVGYCPYGFKQPHHAKACDAAMEMDRALFKRLGADLIIKETVVEGAPKCRMIMKWTG